MVIKKFTLQSAVVFLLSFFLVFGCKEVKEEEEVAEIVFSFEKAQLLGYNGKRVYVISEMINGRLIVNKDSLLLRSKMDLDFLIEDYEYINDSSAVFLLNHSTYHPTLFHIYTSTISQNKVCDGILLFGKRSIVFPGGFSIQGEREYIPRSY